MYTNVPPDMAEWTALLYWSDNYTSLKLKQITHEPRVDQLIIPTKLTTYCFKKVENGSLTESSNSG